MNEVGEVINFEQITKGCREMNVQELMQLLRMDINIFWSWGSQDFTVDNRNRTRMFRMTVNGHHHKGHVYIFVNGLDLFDVYLTKKDGTIVHKSGDMGLYFDQLVEWIDEKVERIPEYR